jgi:hypothetical protein
LKSKTDVDLVGFVWDVTHGACILPLPPCVVYSTEHGTEGSINSAGLAALLDKLVAVELDLSPICRGSEEGPLVAAGDATHPSQL